MMASQELAGIIFLAGQGTGVAGDSADKVASDPSFQGRKGTSWVSLYLAFFVSLHISSAATATGGKRGFRGRTGVGRGEGGGVRTVLGDMPLVKEGRGFQGKRPLLKKDFFFLDAKDRDMRKIMLEQVVQELGGRVHEHLSNEVRYLIADRNDGHEDKELECMLEKSDKGAVICSCDWLRLILESKTWHEPGPNDCVWPRPASGSGKTKRERGDELSAGERSCKQVKITDFISPSKHKAPEGTPDKAFQKTPTQPDTSPASNNKFSSGKKTTPRGSDGTTYKDVLYDYVRNIEKNMASVILHDEHCVVIKDSFPKAKIHYLVLSRRDVKDIFALTKEHLPMLKHMHDVALGIVRDLKERNKDLEGCRIGYHAVPSLNCLHMHIISIDFDSEFLKNGSHWISFQPPFFVDSLDMQRQITKMGSCGVNEEEASNEKKKGDIICHKCGKNFCRQFMELKKHIRTCEERCSSGKVYTGCVNKAGSAT